MKTRYEWKKWFDEKITEEEYLMERSIDTETKNIKHKMDEIQRGLETKSAPKELKCSCPPQGYSGLWAAAPCPIHRNPQDFASAILQPQNRMA